MSISQKLLSECYLRFIWVNLVVPTFVLHLLASKRRKRGKRKIVTILKRIRAYADPDPVI